MTEVATTYGQAMYDLARDENKSRTLLAELSALDQGLRAEPEFLQLLSAPNIPKEERVQILDDSFRGKVHPYLLNFLKILTEKNYIRYFSDCCDAYIQCYNQDNDILSVTAVTAVALSDAQAEKLTAKLAKITGKHIDLVSRIDPSCLGGIRLDYDGKRLDDTVSNRLDTIRDLLKNTVL